MPFLFILLFCDGVKSGVIINHPKNKKTKIIK
ncbi:hypothetical protein SA269_05165 [Aggregatibacter actinomycetemcomitans serotype d str. SA269]|nr:hypothetical protein SA269_05165 [Aggregatibacter actinomycetemcomitans serotype d str. SA269]